MDVWVIMQERYVATIVFMIIIIVSLLSLYATWKKRTDISKAIAIIFALITFSIICAALYGIFWTLFFGYNS